MTLISLRVGVDYSQTLSRDVCVGGCGGCIEGGWLGEYSRVAPLLISSLHLTDRSGGMAPFNTIQHPLMKFITLIEEEERTTSFPHKRKEKN